MLSTTTLGEFGFSKAAKPSSAENGYKIGVGISNVETIGIDTPEDLARAEEFLKNLK